MRFWDSHNLRMAPVVFTQFLEEQKGKYTGVLAFQHTGPDLHPVEHENDESNMGRTVADKMGIKEHARAYFATPDKKALEAMGLPRLDISEALEQEFDYIHLFVKTQSSFIDHFPNLKPHLKSTGMLWVSWPKGGQLETDLTLKTVIKLGYDFGLVESTCLSINQVWSGLKFTHPKKGKIYTNSYGKLKRD